MRRPCVSKRGQFPLPSYYKIVLPMFEQCSSDITRACEQFLLSVRARIFEINPKHLPNQPKMRSCLMLRLQTILRIEAKGGLVAGPPWLCLQGRSALQAPSRGLRFSGSSLSVDRRRGRAISRKSRLKTSAQELTITSRHNAGKKEQCHEPYIIMNSSVKGQQDDSSSRAKGGR